MVMSSLETGHDDTSTVFDGIIDGPIPFASPALQQRPNVKLLTNGRVVDINNKFAAPATPLLFKPFQLDEVFDMNTGKPLFAVNLSTGKLPLPHSPKVNITHTPSSDVAIMQRRGIRDFTVGRGGTFGLKPGAGSFTLTSLLTIPRPDGSLITIPVALFLKELNAYERGLNAHGTTLRDSVTGKISSTPREITVRKLAINHALIKQQRQNIEIKLIKNVNARPWGESEVAARHQAAVVKIPAAMLDSRNRLIGIPPVIPANNKIYLPNAASNPAAKTSEPLRQVNPAMVSSRCSLDLNQPEGGAPREKVSISLKNFDPNACVLHFEDSAGKHVDQPFVTQAGMVLTTQVPEGLAKGAGYISLRDKSKPTAFGTVPFYVGDACTIESVYPPIGMAGTELTLKVRRFKGCAVDFVDASTARTPVNYQFVVDVPGGKGIVAPPFITTSTIILPVPSFTLGKNRIESRLSANNATGQPVNSSFNFSIVRTVADPGGHAPPPDYFARGITPFERKYGWHQPYGDPNNIAVDIFADFSVSSKGQAEDNQVFFRGEGGANATLFNITSEIVGAHAEASVPTATSKENRLRAKFTLTAAGQTFYTWKKEKNKEDGTSDAAAESCQEDEKINGKCCIDKKPNGSCADDEGGLAVQVQFKYEKDFKLLNVDQAGEWNFTVGPVPLIARIGFHGEAGARVKFAMSPLQVIAQVTPYVNTSMYAECAVDLFLVEAGVGVDMILANLALDGAGQVYLDFGQMALVSELYVNFTYDILNGTLYLFVDTFGQRSKFNIFNINDMISQNTGVDLSVLKGNAYLLSPQRMTYPLLQGM